MTDEERMVRTREAAQIVGVHPKTLLQWEKAGRVSAVRQEGTNRRWKVGDLLALRGEGK